jgi:hypothetical protein
VLETKNLNIVITDEADGKLQKVMDEKRFKNRADAVDWIIAEAFRIVFRKAAEQGVER